MNVGNETGFTPVKFDTVQTIYVLDICFPKNYVCSDFSSKAMKSRINDFRMPITNFFITGNILKELSYGLYRYKQ